MKSNPELFCFWLKGFFELSNADTISDKQLQIIKDHLDLVFDKITPDRNGITQTYDGDGLNILHTKHSGLTAQGLCGIGSDLNQGDHFKRTPLIRYC